MDKVYILALLFLLAGALYLNRAYAYFYDFIGINYQSSPYLTDTFLVEGKPRISPSNKLETLKYVSLGDSLTAGVGSKDYKNTYPYLAAQKLLGKSFEVTLVNLARPGATSAEVLNNQIPRAIIEDPDFITILIGINDIHNFVPEKDFIGNYQEILDSLTRKTHARITVIDIPYLGNRLMLFPFDYFYLIRTNQYNSDIKSLSSKYRVNFIDLYSDTKNDFLKNQGLYSPDNFHPNEKGYILWSNFINVD